MNYFQKEKGPCKKFENKKGQYKKVKNDMVPKQLSRPWPKPTGVGSVLADQSVWFS